jgi:hypothetical protein
LFVQRFSDSFFQLFIKNAKKQITEGFVFLWSKTAKANKPTSCWKCDLGENK